jgi:hypothetical protein
MILQWPVNGSSLAKPDLLNCILKLKDLEMVNTHSPKESANYSLQQPTPLFYVKKGTQLEIM